MDSTVVENYGKWRFTFAQGGGKWKEFQCSHIYVTVRNLVSVLVPMPLWSIEVNYSIEAFFVFF